MIPTEQSGSPSQPKGSDALVSALLDGAVDLALKEARALREARQDWQQAVVKSLETALDLMDAKCTTEQFNLLEIMLTGRAAMAVARDTFPEGKVPSRRGTVVIATPEGDVHDLGKNILRMVLSTRGFRVVDLGKDCPVKAMVEAVPREGAFALLVSGLISPAVQSVRLLREMLRERGLSGVRLVAGGAALKQCSALALNVDYVAKDAFDGARYLESVSAS